MQCRVVGRPVSATSANDRAVIARSSKHSEQTNRGKITIVLTSRTRICRCTHIFRVHIALDRSLPHQFNMGGQDQWKEIAAKAQDILYNSIPSEWRIPKDKLPPPEQKDVTNFPAKCGLLTDAELTITDSYATEIVKKIAAGEWKAEDVTRAFCKRAAVAQQVVSHSSCIRKEFAYNSTGQLLDSDHVRRRHRPGEEAR